jgi:hypothetical protein
MATLLIVRRDRQEAGGKPARRGTRIAYGVAVWASPRFRTKPSTTRGGGVNAAATGGENIWPALRRIEENGGAPGADGMTVERLRGCLKTDWLRIAS